MPGSLIVFDVVRVTSLLALLLLLEVSGEIYFRVNSGAATHP